MNPLRSLLAALVSCATNISDAGRLQPMRLNSICRVLCFGLATSFAATSVSNAAASPEVASATRVSDQVDAAWLSAMQAGDAEQLAAPYAADAVFITPAGRAVIGRRAIADLYRAGVAVDRLIIGGGIYREGIRSGGAGLVYEWGRGGSTTIDADGRITTRAGPYLTVWRRDSAGHWEIVRNMAF
jgi:uncharacterized protein (TIGR02246 family)